MLPIAGLHFAAVGQQTFTCTALPLFKAASALLLACALGLSSCALEPSAPLQSPAQGFEVPAASQYELDHIVPLALGGHPRNLKNLMLQPWEGADGAHAKLFPLRVFHLLQLALNGLEVGRDATRLLP